MPHFVTIDAPVNNTGGHDRGVGCENVSQTDFCRLRDRTDDARRCTGPS